MEDGVHLIQYTIYGLVNINGTSSGKCDINVPKSIAISKKFD